VLESVQAGRIPGAVLGVLDGGERALRHAGHAQLVPEKVAMTEATIFDLASLTKVLFTTHQLLLLVEQGRLSLDATLGTLIPDLRQYNVAGAAERRLTVRQCLTHQTHLPAVEPLYTYGQNPATLRAFILQREWRPGPPVYSDINFLLLGIVLERLSGLPLREQPQLPGFSFGADAALCAATEFCTWRSRVLRGEVHDENAAAMGGAAGHAGLFGYASAVLDYAEGLLLGRLLATSSIAELRLRNGATRTLGWEAAHPGWSGGGACSDATIGHTGFTGTGLWIDWQRNRAWTLLTNRVHPSRHADSGIAGLRRAVGEAVCR
jgi:CubicO group peptidase (beta-lactamase class C family)